MHIAAHCVTDLRSLRAVIKAIRATGNPCTELLIPLEVWMALDKKDGSQKRSYRPISLDAPKEYAIGLMIDDCFVY